MSQDIELLELVQKVLTIFNVENISDLGDALMNAVSRGDEKKYQAFVDLVPDLKKDWLQKIYQYYQADREHKKQDFTPYCLASFMARLTDDDSQEIIDMCAGSGALTIQAWNKNKYRHFTLFEIDEKVIPYLLFNLVVRNIYATVYHSDILESKIFSVYNVCQREKYATVTRGEYASNKFNQQPSIQHQMESLSSGGSGQLSLLAV